MVFYFRAFYCHRISIILDWSYGLMLNAHEVGHINWLVVQLTVAVVKHYSSPTYEHWKACEDAQRDYDAYLEALRY